MCVSHCYRCPCSVHPCRAVPRHSCPDRAVDRLYRKKPFDTDKERLEWLFTQNQELTT